MQLKGSKTHGNLKAAFAGESQANRRYLYFAAKPTLKGKTTSQRYSGLPPRAKRVTPTAISNTWSSAAIRRRIFRSEARG